MHNIYIPIMPINNSQSPDITTVTNKMIQITDYVPPAWDAPALKTG